ncbi:XRE family transcriptional regulator, partial [Clostridioides difficile]
TLVSIANALGVSVDELLYDTILDSKVVFEKELSDILKDCNDYGLYLILHYYL